MQEGPEDTGLMPEQQPIGLLLRRAEFQHGSDEWQDAVICHSVNHVTDHQEKSPREASEMGVKP